MFGAATGAQDCMHAAWSPCEFIIKDPFGRKQITGEKTTRQAIHRKHWKLKFLGLKVECQRTTIESSQDRPEKRE